MTRSYGGGPPERQKKQQPDLRSSEDDRQPWERRLDSLSRYSDGEQLAIQPVKVDFGKRFVAAMIDVFAAYVVATIVAMIPYLNAVLSLSLVFVVILLLRDWFYEGRGIGKNLMGLQVVDIKTGRPLSLMQSFKRNVVLLAAPLLLYIFLMAVAVLRLLPLPMQLQQQIDQVIAVILSVLNAAGFIYVILSIPYEAYRAYNREDGRRFGDQFAGTAIIDAPMDFSHLLPPRQ